MTPPPAQETMPEQDSPEDAAEQRRVMRGLLVSLAINAVLPVVMYHALKHWTHLKEFPILVATGIPSLIDGLVGVIRRRRVDFMAGFTLFTVALSLGLIALGGDPKLYLIRESMLTAGYGLALLISLPLRRPLGYYSARYFMTGGDSGKAAEFEALWGERWFQRAICEQTLIWGVGTLLEAAARIALVFALPIPRFLIVSPIVQYGLLGIFFLISQAAMRRTAPAS